MSDPIKRYPPHFLVPHDATLVHAEDYDALAARLAAYAPLAPPSQGAAEVFVKTLDRNPQADMRAIPNEWLLRERGLSSSLNERLAEAEALLREARMGVKNSAVQFGYPYTEYVDRIDAFLAPDSAKENEHE